MQNPFDMVLLAKDSQKRAENTRNHAQRLYEHKPFYIRWHGFNATCKALSYLCQFISPLPTFAVFFFLFNEQFIFLGSISPVMAALLSLGLSVGIEFTKRYSTKNALISIFNYRDIGLAMFIAIFCSLISIGTSFWGSYTLPSKFTAAPTATAPNLIDLAKLEQQQANVIRQNQDAIKAKKDEIKTYEKNNKSSSANRMSRRAGVKEGHGKLTAQLHTLEKELLNLQKSNPTIIQNARKSNEKATTAAAAAQTTLTTQHNHDTASKGLILGYFSLALEIVFWLAMIFVFWYYRRVKTEFEQNPTLSGQPTPNEQSQPETEEAAQQPKIGFITDFQQLANSCTTTNQNGTVQLTYKGKTYSLEGLRNNYHANKSKAKKYSNENKPTLSEKYKNASTHWANLIKIFEQKKVPS